MPNWFFILAIVYCIIVFVIYITVEIQQIKKYKHKQFKKEFYSNIAKQKKSNSLSDFYTNVAYGDKEDFSYWYDTAELFK